MKREAGAAFGVVVAGAAGVVVVVTFLSSLAGVEVERTAQALGLVVVVAAAVVEVVGAGFASSVLGASCLGVDGAVLVVLPKEKRGTWAGTVGNSTCLPKVNLGGAVVVVDAGTTGALPLPKGITAGVVAGD